MKLDTDHGESDIVRCGEDDDAFTDEKLMKIWKRNELNKCLANNDKLSMKTLAISNGGFIENDLRVQLWCKLSNADNLRLPQLSSNEMQSNEFYQQVIMDVKRSLKRFPPSVEENKRILYQDSLTNMVIRILQHNPSMYYYQGYHDVCLTFLLMMEEEKAFQVAMQISRSHLKYFMEKTMNTTSNLLEIIYLILYEENKDLYDYLHRSEVGTIFSLSWVITWFSHVLNSLDDIFRLFDFFISSHFLMPIYLTVSILLYKCDDIYQIECDMASMHQYLSHIPDTEQLPYDKLIKDTLLLSLKYPPEETLQRQQEVQKLALKEDSTKYKLLTKSCKFVRKNIFSLTFVGLLSAIVFQFYNEYYV